MGLLQKLMVLYAVGLSQIGGAKVGLLHKLVVLRSGGTVSEIGGAEMQWDCYRNWWC